MGGEVNSIGVAKTRDALAWWLQAGVDIVIQEEPRNWLKPITPRQQPATTDAPPPVTETPTHETLEQFHGWLATSEQLPMASRSARRVLPSGAEQAPVMLLADAPEDASGGPISGDAWELATRMLAAISISAEEAYTASLSCFHAPGARMSGEDRQACADIARTHVRLAQPRRLLLLGDGPCLALLGKRLIEARGHVHRVEGVRAVATFHPRHLIKRPLDKSLAWQDLLLLMEDES